MEILFPIPSPLVRVIGSEKFEWLNKNIQIIGCSEKFELGVSHCDNIFIII